MRTENILIITAYPSTQPTLKHRSFASLSLRRRSMYGRERHCNAGKELDNETGLYYYGARYLDPKTSRWLSGDPAMGEYVPQAPVSEEAKKRNGSLPGMGGVFNYANLHVYHYAGNNPVRCTDPDGRLTKDEISKRNNTFSNILLSVNSWNSNSGIDITSTRRGRYQYKQGELSNQGLSLLNRIGKGQACTGGAINLRNEYREQKLPVNGWAVDLKNGDDISYFRDSAGNIEKDTNKIFDMLEIGDLLIYTNDANPNGIKNGEWTGHTATVIGKESEFVITAEFHENGKKPTVTKLHKDALMWMSDTNLYGGARWNE